MSEAQVIQASIPGEENTHPNDSPEPSVETPAEEFTVPDKFKNEDGTANIEQILKAHGELETKLGTAAVETPPVDPAAEATLDLPEEKAGAGFMENLSEWSAEYAKGEGLSDDTYSKIQKDYGVDKAGADRVIAGEQAIADAAVRKIVDSVGGQESYNEMLGWLAQNDGRDSVNELTSGLMDAMLAGDQARVDRELGGAQARFKEGTRKGWSPELTGRDVTGNTIQPFSSQAEVDKAQASPEYLSGDDAYQREFNQKLKLSMDMGVVS